MNGALTTSTHSKVILINGAKAKNVFWKIEGAVSINNFSVFCGTIVCYNGALGAINTGVVLDGRALTTSGTLITAAVSTSMTPFCTLTAIHENTDRASESFGIYPNPFRNSINIKSTNTAQPDKIEFRMYNLLGVEVMNTFLTKQSNTVSTGNIPSRIYFYKIISNKKIIQSGRLVSNQ